jgi:hypothetical protein
LYRDRDKALAHLDGKNCAIPARHRDSFLAHNRDSRPDGFAGNANSLNCRAVIVHKCQIIILNNMIRPLKIAMILLLIGCNYLQAQYNNSIPSLEQKDTSLIKKYMNLLDKSSGMDKDFINALISTMTHFQRRNLDTTILTYATFDTDNLIDTIQTRVYVAHDTVFVMSIWEKNGQILWFNKLKNPYVWINDNELFQGDKRSIWVTFTIGYKYAVPDIYKIKDYNNLFDYAVENGIRDLQRIGIGINNETYKQYLKNYKGNLIAWGDPEIRHGMYIWYDPAKIFILFYHD